MANGKIVVIGTSTGGLQALKTVLQTIPSDLPAPILVVMHIGSWDSILPEVLRDACAVPVEHAANGAFLRPSTVYVAPPDRHMLVSDGMVRLTKAPKENYTRPAIDPLFRSAAVEYGISAVGVILTGELDDGAAGLRAIAACGGQTIVQSPESSIASSMPLAAIRAANVDTVVPLDEIAAAIVSAVEQTSTTMTQDNTERSRAEIETRIALVGRSTPADLDSIGKPSKLTCPDCGGVVWRVGDGAPLRYRCHTGHAFSALSLDQAQERSTETALWVTIRHLDERLLLAHEQIQMEEDLKGNVAVLLRANLSRIEHARHTIQNLLLNNAMESLFQPSENP